MGGRASYTAQGGCPLSFGTWVPDGWESTTSCRLGSGARLVAEAEGSAKDFVKDDGLAEVAFVKMPGERYARGTRGASQHRGLTLLGLGPFEFVFDVLALDERFKLGRPGACGSRRSWSSWSRLGGRPRAMQG